MILNKSNKIFVIVIVTFLVAFTISYSVNSFLMGSGSKDKHALSGEHSIQVYQHFLDLCAKIMVDETSIDTYIAVIGKPNSYYHGNYLQVIKDIAQIDADRTRTIAQYNADARKSYTTDQFRSLQLVYQLPDGFYNKRTNCHRIVMPNI